MSENEEREEPWVAPRRAVAAAAVDYVEAVALELEGREGTRGGAWVRLRKAVEAYQKALPNHGRRGG